MVHIVALQGKLMLAIQAFRELVQVLAAPLPTQLPADAPKKAMPGGPDAWALAAHVGTPMVSTWANPSYCSHLKSEAADAKSVCLSLVSLC